MTLRVTAIMSYRIVFVIIIDDILIRVDDNDSSIGDCQTSLEVGFS